MKRHLVAGALLLLTAGCATESPDDAAAASGRGGEERASLDCPAKGQTPVDLDVPGPGTSTPEQAVAPFADGPTTLVTEAKGSATVHALGPDGTVTRVFQVKQREDGWWPDSYTECAG